MQQNEAKIAAKRSGLLSDRKMYCKLRNQVTELDRRKQREYYQREIKDSKNERKTLWKMMNDIMDRSSHQAMPNILHNGLFRTKTVEIAKYFNNYLLSETDNLKK